MITRTFKLCLNAGTGSAPFINVSQTDKDEVWLFELYTETGERYIPSSGAIIGIKSDGHGIANTGTVDSEGRVVITETEQMTAAAGRAIYELSIDGLTHGTANFIVNVEKKPIDGAIMSDSDLSLISQAVDSAAVIVDVIGDGDPSEVIGEHVDAWLDNHPEATTTVQDGAITAPKINQSLWDKLLVSEEASGAVASFDDGADDVPVSSLKVNLEPIQLGSGDPSPTNIRPIYPANGKNLANFVNGYGIDTSGQVVAYGTRIATVNPITIKSGVSYKVIYSGNATGAIYAVFNGSTLVRRNFGLASGAVLDTSGGDTLYVCVYASESVMVTVDSSHAMVVDSSITDFTYQPYQGIMVERCGKNLVQKIAKGYIRIESNQYIADGASESVLFYATKGATYTVSASVPLTRSVIARTASDNVSATCPVYDVSTVYPSFTWTATFSGWAIWYIHPSLDADIEASAMVEVGTTASDYEAPKTPTQYPYTLGQSVYGGTVDLATGVLTVTHGIYTVSAVDSLVTKTGFIRVRSTNPTEAYASSSNEKNAITNNMVFNYAGIIGFNGNPSVPFSFYVSGSYTYFVLPTSAATDVATANTWFTNNPTTVVYPLATPTTVQLTPQEVKTLLGYNNISSSGTVDVIYHADTKLYVDKMTNVDNNIIAPTEETFTATRNYTVNDLVIVADTLYKVTANIASGSVITPNSNVTQTTLSALIKALS